MNGSSQPRHPQSLLGRISDFFYSEEAPYNLALLRILLPMVVLVGVIPRWFHIRELYSSDGSPTPLVEAYGQENLLPILSPSLAIAAYTALVFFLITTCLGWRTRTSLFCVAVLYPYFGLLDSLGTITKYIVIGAHLFFLLGLSGCGSVWSLDAWIAGRSRTTEPIRFPVWPRRLIQLLIGFVYLGAATTKMQMPAFFNGDQLSYWMLTNVNFPNPVGEALSGYPALIIAFAYFTVLFEVLFVFLAWQGPAKRLLLCVGVVFHLLTIFALGLLIFPLMFMSTYVAFLTESEARWLGAWLGRLWARVGVIAAEPQRDSRWRGRIGSRLSFVGALGIVVGLGLTAEARMDVYGERRAEGAYILQAIPRERVDELLRNDSHIAARDTVFDFDCGTRLIGGLLADSRTEFRGGETAILHCRWAPPHEDLWVEVFLQESGNRIVQRYGQVVPREATRTSFAVEIPSELPTGEYAFALRVSGEEVHKKHITVTNGTAR